MEPKRPQNLDGFTHSPRTGAPLRPPAPATRLTDFGPLASQPSRRDTPHSAGSIAKPSTPPVRPQSPSSQGQKQPVTGYVTTPLPRSHTTTSEPSKDPNPELKQVNTELDQAGKEKEHKPRKENSHAGLIGMAIFLLLTVLFVLPILPGKTLDNFPGSSQSFSSGEQSFACLEQPSDVKTTTAYTSKAGFPLTYKYTSTTTQQATCDGQGQTIIASQSSQLNPLGLIGDVVLALAIAMGIAKLWSVMYRATHKPQRVE